jgi:polyisoprenoid-binding protein YceI
MSPAGAVLAAGIALAAPATVAAAPWTIDPTHTFVNFEATLFGLSTQRGRFGRGQGELEFDAAARRGRVDFVVDTGSVNTGAPALDDVLRQLLDSRTHPQARFVADRFTFDGAQVSAVDGRLTLRGRTAPLTLKALRFDCYPNPLFRRQVCGGDFEATLRRSDWGLEGGAEVGLADSLRLLVQIEAVAP